MKKVIVISGANLFNGGTLSIMQECLKYLDGNLAKDYRVIALINKSKSFQGYENIEFIEIPSMRKSYFHRLYYEYYRYKSLSINLSPYLWLSLNDMSSNIRAVRRAVYCHNPSPFREITSKDILDQPQLFFFSLFYKFLYKINIHKNDYVIVQQNWIKKEFVKFFNLCPDKVVVARPLDLPSIEVPLLTNKSPDAVFFYPAVARPFKNLEVVINAVKLLKEKGCTGFKVILTIDGSENNYARRMINLAAGLDEIQFVGLLSREQVACQYADTDCLLFPSKLETWGLPITEFKALNKPIFLANLPYAKETLGKYDKAVFFDQNDEDELARLMFRVINSQNIEFSTTVKTEYIEPNTKNWEQLFNLLLSNS